MSGSFVQRKGPSGPQNTDPSGGGIQPPAGQIDGTTANPLIVGITEETTGVQTELDIGSIPDGTFLKRVGAFIVGAAIGAGVTSFNGRSGVVAPASGDYAASQITNDSGVAGVGVAAALNTLNTAIGSLVPTSRTLTTTSPLRIDGGASADLSVNRTLSVNTVSNTSLGVVPAITAGTAALVSDAGGTTPSWAAISGGGSPVGTSRTISTTAPLAGGGDLSANRTLTVATVSNTSSGVAPQTNGTAGQALLAGAAAASPTWGTDFVANDLTTTGNLLLGPTSRSTAGLVRVAHGSTIVSARNNANSGNRTVLSYGVTSADATTLGDSAVGGSYRILASGQQDAYIVSTREYSMGAQQFNFRPDSAADWYFVSTGVVVIQLYAITTSTTRNIGFYTSGGFSTWNSMNRGFFVTTATAGPTANPTGGSYMWADTSTSAFIWLSPAGTVAIGNTTYAATVTGAVGSALVGTSNCLRWDTNKLGLYNTAPVAQQTVTGSRGGNAALADLLTKLATLGAIVDGTTA